MRGCDEEQIGRLAEDDPVPHAARHQEDLARLQRRGTIGRRLLQHHVDRAREQAEQLVAVRMHLALVWMERIGVAAVHGAHDAVAGSGDEIAPERRRARRGGRLAVGACKCTNVAKKSSAVVVMRISHP